jgi:hypothetical protein
LIGFDPDRLHQRLWQREIRRVDSAPFHRFFGYSFLLHLLWKNAQAPLYEGFTDDVAGHLRACFYVTATGDMDFPFSSFLRFWPRFTGHLVGGPWHELSAILQRGPCRL